MRVVRRGCRLTFLGITATCTVELLTQNLILDDLSLDPRHIATDYSPFLGKFPEHGLVAATLSASSFLSALPQSLLRAAALDVFVPCQSCLRGGICSAWGGHPSAILPDTIFWAERHGNETRTITGELPTTVGFQRRHECSKSGNAGVLCDMVFKR